MVIRTWISSIHDQVDVANLRTTLSRMKSATHAHTHILLHTHTLTLFHMRAHTHTHTHAHTRTHIHTHTHTHHVPYTPVARETHKSANEHDVRAPTDFLFTIDTRSK